MHLTASPDTPLRDCTFLDPEVLAGLLDYFGEDALSSEVMCSHFAGLLQRKHTPTVDLYLQSAELAKVAIARWSRTN